MGDFINMLLEKGADVEARDRKGHSAVWYAKHGEADKREKNRIEQILWQYMPDE